MLLNRVILPLISPNWCSISFYLLLNRIKYRTTSGNNLKQKRSNFINFLVTLLSHLVNQTQICPFSPQKIWRLPDSAV